MGDLCARTHFISLLQPNQPTLKLVKSTNSTNLLKRSKSLNSTNNNYNSQEKSTTTTQNFSSSSSNFSKNPKRHKNTPIKLEKIELKDPITHFKKPEIPIIKNEVVFKKPDPPAAPIDYNT